MKIASLLISMPFLISVIYVDIYAQKTDSDQEMSAQEQADFLNTMFPLAKKNGIDMNIVRIDSQNNNIVKNDFTATFKDGEKALNQVLIHPENATAIQLLVATDMTFHSGNLHEAAFLFYLGRIRLSFDLEKYPPKESIADKTEWFLNVLKNDVRIDLVHDLYLHPKILAKVVKQIEASDLKEPAGYNSGWEYTSKDVPADLLATIKGEFLETLKPMAVLLNNTEYFEAFSTMCRCNELPFDQQDDKDVVDRRAKAEDVMRRIEKEKDLHGLMHQIEDQPSESK
jgi:hypothetical protein